MKWTWDEGADATYITLADSRHQLVTVDLTEGGFGEVHLDVDRVTGSLVGIEILDSAGGNLFTKLKGLLKPDPEILGG